jgi:predicted RNase H-like HicB family nuclease
MRHASMVDSACFKQQNPQCAKAITEGMELAGRLIFRFGELGLNFLVIGQHGKMGFQLDLCPSDAQAVDTVKNTPGGQAMRFLIMLDQTETGFAVRVPGLAVTTYGENIEAAKRAASEPIQINLEAYQEAGQPVPDEQVVARHLRAWLRRVRILIPPCAGRSPQSPSPPA